MSGGDKLKSEAEKILKRTTIFGFGKNQKFEDAAETYIKAANAYKLSKQWQEAGDCFISAADCQKQTDSPNDCVNSYVEAGNCFKKVHSSFKLTSSPNWRRLIPPKLRTCILQR